MTVSAALVAIATIITCFDSLSVHICVQCVNRQCPALLSIQLFQEELANKT